MKKQFTFYLIMALATGLSAQILWQDDFESYDVGQFTDQNGWELDGVQPGWVQIVELDESKGKSIQILSSFENDSGMFVTHLTDWENRDSGNDIVSLSLDFFTGQPTEGYGMVVLSSQNYQIAIEIGWDQEMNTLNVVGNEMVITLVDNPTANTWYFIEALYNTQTGEVKARVNGQEALTGMTTANITPHYFDYAAIFETQLGIDNVVVSATNTFDLGVKDLSNSISNTVIYPNPVVDVLHLQTDKSIAQISLIDFSGRTIATVQNQKSLDVQSLASGNYLLRINFKDGSSATKKFIKK